MIKDCKEKFNCNHLYKVILIWSIFAVIISLFSYGLTYIHSDNAVELSAIKAMLGHRSLFPREWIYGNGDINLMRIQVFLTLPYLLIGNKPIARELGSLIIIILACISIRNLAKKVFNEDAWLIAVPVFLIMLGGKSTRDIVLYSCMYTSTIIWITVLLALFNEIHNNNSDKRRIALFCLIEGLVLIGGTRWIAEITIPLMMLSIYLIYLEGKKSLKLLFYVLVPSFVGFAIFKLVAARCDFFVNTKNALTLPDTLGEIGKNALVVFENLFECFGFNGGSSVGSLGGMVSLISISACLLICFVLPTVQLVRFKSEAYSVKLFLVYAYAHNVLLIATAVLTSKLLDYHMVTVIFMNILISARFIYAAIAKSDRFIKGFFVLVFAFAILCESIYMLSFSKGWKADYDKQREFASKLASTGAEKGYGSFWNAYANETYSDNGFRMGAIKIEDFFISAYFCLTDRTVFNEEDCKSFLILNEEENEMYGTVEYFFEKPVDEWVEKDVPVFDYFTKDIEKQNLYVYVYDYDIASRLNNGVSDGIIKPIELVVNDDCEKNFEYIVMNPNGIVHGPYNTIYKSNYTLRVEGTDVNKLDLAIKTQYKGALKYTVDDSQSNCVTINLDVKKSIDDLDIVLTNKTDNAVVLQNITVERH